MRQRHAAVLLQHTSAPVHFDPPVTDESIAAAKQQQALDQALAALQMATYDDKRMAAVETLRSMMAEWGPRKMQAWCKNLADEMAGRL
jgi:hypothetical protein